MKSFLVYCNSGYFTGKVVVTGNLIGRVGGVNRKFLPGLVSQPGVKQP